MGDGCPAGYAADRPTGASPHTDSTDPAAATTTPWSWACSDLATSGPWDVTLGRYRRCSLSRKPMTSDQKRALVILIITAVVIAILAIGVAWLVGSLGAPAWITVAVAVVVAALVGLFMFLQLS
jgi:hypothetical protein